ncbi:MAG TPA: TetR family transcriptional regulator [Bacteroidales bacterium]|nr:TetR family transcriptional regulator [Bacteroidales bacterium]
MKKTGAMQISELAKISGVPVSTIRYYIREGLLPQPMRTGKTRAYYSSDYLKGIELIKKKQAVGNKSLDVIRKEIEKKFPQQENASDVQIPAGHREKIISSATELFSSKGYAETSIADIAGHAKISKETFYIHFKNKEELFIECADIVFHNMYNHVWQEIKDEKNIIERSKKRARAFMDSFPKWITMMNLVRSLSVGNNPALREKFKNLLNQMIGPISKDYERFKKESNINRIIDSTIAGYFIMGMAESGAMLIERGVCTEDEVINYVTTIIMQGL